MGSFIIGSIIGTNRLMLDCVTQSSASTHRLGGKETVFLLTLCSPWKSKLLRNSERDAWDAKLVPLSYLWDKIHLNYTFKRLTSASPPADKLVSVTHGAALRRTTQQALEMPEAQLPLCQLQSAAMCTKPSLTCVAGSALLPVTLNYCSCVTFHSRCSNYCSRISFSMDRVTDPIKGPVVHQVFKEWNKSLYSVRQLCLKHCCMKP